MEDPGVAAVMVVALVTVEVATRTTAAEETVEAEEARLVEAVAREPVRPSDEVAGAVAAALGEAAVVDDCLLYTSPSPRDKRQSRMPSSA